MSISASWLVLAVLLLRFVLKKAPKWVSVLLWGFVAIRLICPFSFESVLSLVPSAETISPEIMADPTPVVHTGIPSLNSTINPIVTDSFAPDPTVSVNPLQIWITVASVFWLTGIAIMLIYTVISYLLLRRKVATAVLLRNNVFQSENVASAFVLGIFQPKIYLPFQIDETSLEHVIAHEEGHIQRKDHWWKPLGFTLLALHWFNPLMWIGYIFLCRDIELACDEKVIKDLSNEKKADYTEALLACSINRRSIAACPLAFGEVGVKKRVKSVMNYKKPAFWIILAAMITCTVVAVCFLTNPISKTLQSIDGYDLSIPNETTPVFVLEDGAYVYAGAVDKEQVQAFYDLRISSKEISQDRSEDRNKAHSLMIQTIPSDTSLLSSYLPGVYFHFNEDFTQVWANDEVKPTLTYKVKDPKKAQAIYLDITQKSSDPIATIEGNFRTYYSMADGSWQYNGKTYQYRLEITGRMPNAKVDSTFVYLSNLKNITFDQAYKAAGLSSNLNDYFSEEEAVLVEWIQEEPPSTEVSDRNTLVNKPESKLDAAISDAILSYHKSELPDGFLNTVSHIILVDEIVSGTPLAGQTGHIQEETVYVYYLYLCFDVQAELPEEHQGIYGQAAITFKVDENGKYTVKHFVKPESSVDSGADYPAELKNKFVAASEDIAENEEKYSKQLLDGCWATATDYIHNKKASSSAQPGGNPENQIFDNTLSWAGWTGDGPIFLEALNRSELTTNHTMHLPIYKFQSKASLDRFIEKYRDTFNMDQSRGTIASFTETAGRYTEDFFKDHTLVLVYVASDSISYRYSATSFHCDGTSFVLHIEETTGLEAGDSAVAGWFVTVAVSNDLIKNCSVFDAYM